MDPTAVYPPVAVTPLFWSHVGRLSSPSSSTSPLVTVTSATSTNNSSASAPTAADIAAAKFLKAKLFELHPELPYVVCADVADVVRVFDMQSNKCVCVWELVDIIRAVRQAGSLSSRSSSSASSSLPVYSAPEDAAKRLGQIGHVKRVAFIDRLALSWTCGFVLPEDCAGYSQSSTLLMVLTDAALFFLDYTTGVVHELNAYDLGTRPPTYAEFVYPNVCAIGTSDGLIRLWNMNDWNVAQTLNGHFKDIVCIKNCVSKRISSWDRQQPQASAMGRVRLVSASSDGVVYLWLGQAAPVAALAVGGVGGLGGASVGISFPGEAPAAQLSCPGLMEAFFDECYDVLYTVSSDRVTQLWDLGSVKERQAPDAKTKAAGRRRSILGGGGAAADPKVHCVAKAKLSSNDLPSSLSKYTSIHGLEHPRYPDPVFAVSAKNASIGIVQLINTHGGDDGKSESSSVKSGGTGADMSLKYRLVHELHVTSLFLNYLSSLSKRDPSVSVTPLVVAACKDPTMRVYAVRSHNMFPNILVAATSVGILAFSLHNPSVDAGAGSAVATHFAWGNHYMTFADRCVKVLSVKVDGGIANQREGTLIRRGNSYNVASHAGDSIDGSTHSASVRGGASAIPPVSGSRYTVEEDGMGEDESGINVEVVDEYSPVASVGGARGGASMDANTAASSSSASKTSGLSLGVLATISSRPVFYPSCSGLFGAVFFPDTLFYLVLKVNIEDRKAVPGAAAVRRSFTRTSSLRKADLTSPSPSRMNEVERGMCYSIAWTCVIGSGATEGVIGGGGSEGSVTDLLCVITTPKKVESTTKRRMSLFGGGDSKKKSGGGVIPSMLVVKEVRTDGKMIDVINPGAPDSTCEVIGGGTYLCVTSPAVGSGTGAGSKQKAVSKVELEAAEERNKQTPQAAQVSLDFTLPEDSSGASRYSNIVPPEPPLKSQFYRAVLEGGGIVASAATTTPSVLVEQDVVDLDESLYDGASAPTTTTTTTAATTTRAGDAKLRLEAVGPVFMKITSVQWDRALGLAAITTVESNKITILALSDTNSTTASTTNTTSTSTTTGSLRVVGSVEIPSSSSSSSSSSSTSLQRMWWHCGTLFVVTATGVTAVFSARGSNSSGSSSASTNAGDDLWKFESVPVSSLHQSCDISRLNSGSTSAVLPTRPYGWLEPVAVIGSSSSSSSSGTSSNSTSSGTNTNTGAGGGGYLVVAARSGHLSAFPLTRSPALAAGMLLSLLHILPPTSTTCSNSTTSSTSSTSIDSAAAVLGGVVRWLGHLPPSPHQQLQTAVASALLSDDNIRQLCQYHRSSRNSNSGIISITTDATSTSTAVSSAVLAPQAVSVTQVEAWTDSSSSSGSTSTSSSNILSTALLSASMNISTQSSSTSSHTASDLLASKLRQLNSTSANSSGTSTSTSSISMPPRSALGAVSWTFA